MRERRDLATAADAAEKAGRKPTEEQRAAKQALAAQRKLRKPSQEDLEKDARQWRAGPWAVIGARANELATWQGLPLPASLRILFLSRQCVIIAVLYILGVE